MKAITKKDTECIIVSFIPIKEGTIMEGYAVIDKEAALKNKKEDGSLHLYNAIIPCNTVCAYDNYTAYAKGIIVGEEIL